MHYSSLTNSELLDYAQVDSETTLEVELTKRLDSLLQYVQDLETEHEAEKDKLERENEELQETIDKLADDLAMCQHDKQKLEEKTNE